MQCEQMEHNLNQFERLARERYKVVRKRNSVTFV